MNNDLEWIWKEFAMAHFKLFYKLLLAGTEETHKSLSQTET
jgi:hypothetical protein